MRKGKY